MKKIHIQNTEGQNICSKEHRKNKNNIIQISHDFNQMDKQLYCKKCAKSIGAPYFSDDDIFEMELL